MIKSTVIVPVFNQAALTTQCLETILEREECNVIVVNDASTDQTVELLTSFGDQISVVTHRKNSGFARSCNDGAALAETRYVVFLNNDTIPQPGWLKQLERYADTHPRAAVVGSKLVYPVNTIQHAGVVVCQDRYPRHIYSGFPSDHPAVNKSRRFQIVTGACMLVRRRVFNTAGGFDTGFRNGFEDVDFCLRLGRDGHEVHYCADSLLQHLESVSPNRFKHDQRNVERYRARWLNRVQPDDFHYYMDDGLLQLSYEGRYPITFELSPSLACVDTVTRQAALERALQLRSREIAELQRENTRLSLDLGRCATDSPELSYKWLCGQVRELAQKVLPLGATVLVVSKGDSSLLEISGCTGWHFPQNERGTYAGYYPADSAAAIAHLEALRAKGAQYLLVPRTAFWWFSHYAALREHLEAHYRIAHIREDLFVIFALDKPTAKNDNSAEGNQFRLETLAHELTEPQSVLGSELGEKLGSSGAHKGSEDRTIQAQSANTNGRAEEAHSIIESSNFRCKILPDGPGSLRIDVQPQGDRSHETRENPQRDALPELRFLRTPRQPLEPQNKAPLEHDQPTARLQASLPESPTLSSLAPANPLAWLPGDYRQIIRSLHHRITDLVPPGSTILVVSKGDPKLIEFPNHKGWHFPRNDDGSYTGYYPAGSFSAIEQLEAQRAKGAAYLAFPATASWWLDFYTEFREHLSTRYRVLFRETAAGIIFDLTSLKSDAEAAPPPQRPPPSAVAHTVQFDPADLALRLMSHHECEPNIAMNTSHFCGQIDSVSNWRICGWIINKKKKALPTLCLLFDGKIVDQVKPSLKREDIALLYGTNVNTGFIFDISKRHFLNGAGTVQVKELETGYTVAPIPELLHNDVLYIDTHEDYKNELARNTNLLEAIRPDKNLLIQLNNNPNIRQNIDPGIGNIHIFNGIPNSATEIFRAYALAESLRQLGYTALVFATNDLPYVNTDHLLAAVFVRVAATDAVLSIIKRMKQEGVKIFCDFDDLVFRPSLMHKIDGVRFISETERERYRTGMLGYRAMIANADAAIVTTQHLARHVSSINHNVFVLKNYPLKSAREAAHTAPVSKRSHSAFVLGYYSGTLTHQADFAVCALAIESIMREFSHVRLRIVGAFELSEFPGFKDLLERIDTIPFMSYGKMIEDIAAKVDLVIAPLEIGNEFCESKSELKFFDAALCGVPVLASATEVFSSTISHRKTGLLAEKQSAWFDNLRFAILNREELLEIGRSAKHVVEEAYSVEKQLAETSFLLEKNGITSPRIRIKPARPTEIKQPTVLTSERAESLAVLLPDLLVGSGGHRKALAFCSEYQRRGGKVEIIFISNREAGELKNMVHQYYCNNLDNIRPYRNQAPVADVVVATSWPTAYEVDEWSDCRRKYYFVQDFEPLFHPMSTEYAKAYHTYRLGLEIITFGRWNQNYILNTFGIKSTAIDFPIEKEIYYPDPDIERKKTILFYARPSQPRRLYELGREALLKLRPYIPGWNIAFFGEQIEPILEGVTVLGKITDLDQLRRMYSEASIGLAFSSTNPSLIPFEMLACGLPVIDVDLGYRDLDFKGCAGIKYSAPTSKDLVRTMYELVSDSSLLAGMHESAIEWSQQRPTETEYALAVLRALGLSNDALS
jgi:GT2 family glycosyltransferase/glycosyltransferase involved in cell wall biosynthesis